MDRMNEGRALIRAFGSWRGVPCIAICIGVMVAFVTIFGACSTSASALPETNDGDNPKAERTASRLPAGVYHGAYRVSPPFGTVVVYRRAEVEVAVKNGRIHEIEVVRPRRLSDRLRTVTDAVIHHQSTDVDITSGASWSKTAVLKAVKTALACSTNTQHTGTGGAELDE